MRLNGGTWRIAILMALQCSGIIAHFGRNQLIRLGCCTWPNCIRTWRWPARPMMTRLAPGMMTTRCLRGGNGGPPGPGRAQAGCIVQAAQPSAGGPPAASGPPGARYTCRGVSGVAAIFQLLLVPAGAGAVRPAFLIAIGPAVGWDVPWSTANVTSEPASAAATIQPAVRLVSAAAAVPAALVAPARRDRGGSGSGPLLFWPGTVSSGPADSSYSLTSAPSPLHVLRLCVPGHGADPCHRGSATSPRGPQDAGPACRRHAGMM